MNTRTKSGAFGNSARYANASTTPTGTSGGYATVTITNNNPTMGRVRIQGTLYVDPVSPSINLVSKKTEKNKYANYTATSTTRNYQGRYVKGKDIKIDAIPNDGYEFVGFTMNGQTYKQISMTLTGDITVTANFKKSAAQTFTVNAVPNDAKMGQVSGGGTYAKGTTINLIAKPNEGYKFVRWEGIEFGGNVQDNQSNPVQHAVSGNRTITAIFETSAGKNDEEPGGGGYSGGGPVEEPTGTLTSTAEGLTMEKVVAFAKKNWIVLLVAAIVLYKISNPKRSSHGSNVKQQRSLRQEGSAHHPGTG